MNEPDSPAPIENPADPDHPVHELIRRRWSPRHFSDQAVSVETVRSLLEAARWAPSSYNEQPWAFVVARREEGTAWEGLLGCLVEANQRWAHRAPLLIATFAKRSFERDGKENRHARHDLGLSVAQLVLEATARGLLAHQMAGIDRSALIERYGVPEGWEAMTAIALGYPSRPEEDDSEAREEARTQRTRKPLGDFVFGERWGRPTALLG